MALTKRQEVDQVTFNPQTGTINWRVTSIIEEDGVEIQRSYARTSVEADYEDFPDSPVLPTEVLDHVQINKLHSNAKKQAARDRRAAALAKFMASAPPAPQAGPPA